MKILILLGVLALIIYAQRRRLQGISRSGGAESEPVQDSAESLALPAPAQTVAPPPCACQCHEQHGDFDFSHPLVKVIELSTRIDRVKQSFLALKEDKETARERSIIKEQLRCAAFERDLILAVSCGHHPDPRAIDIAWSYTSAELSLSFAKARIDRLTS
jgi:hypothetical protein